MREKNGDLSTEQQDRLTLEDVLKKLLVGANDTVNRAIVVHNDTPPIIQIPSSMDKKEAANELLRQHKEEETELDVDRKFDNWKWQDVLVAIKITAEHYFGWINAQKSFFNPPTEIQVIVDYEKGLPVKTTCFYGEFKVNALEGALCNIMPRGGVVHVSFNVKKKYKKKIEEWYELIDKHLRENSIYRGKSISVTSSGSQVQFQESVAFQIIETKSNSKIVLNNKEQVVLEQYCMLDLQEKGKRTYLFTGDYGNGKTEAAMMLGDEAKKLGMCFFYCKDSNAFIELLTLAAKNYSPCLIFMEDVDEIGGGVERTHEINELLNTLDGAETKNKDIKVLFTTNHPEAIGPALIRPGRLDLIVKFENPDAEATAEIFRRYFEGVVGADKLDYDSIALKTENCSGAFVAEICKRALRLAKLKGSISDKQVIAAVATIQDHLALTTRPVVDHRSKVIDAMQLIYSTVSQNVATNGVVGADFKKMATEVTGTIVKSIAMTEDSLTKKIGGSGRENAMKIAEVKEDTLVIKKRLS